MRILKQYKISLLAILLLPIILSSFYLIKGVNQKPESGGRVIGKTSQELPVRLTIPAINVDADVQAVGVNSKGEMEVPDNTLNVAWFKLGPKPGDWGSAVIAGHVDGENGNPGVFKNLHKLKPGDEIQTEDENGVVVTFVVRESRIYDSNYVAEVFSSVSGTHLNLVTCDGFWNNAIKSYSKRLVVFSDIEP